MSNIEKLGKVTKHWGGNVYRFTRAKETYVVPINSYEGGTTQAWSWENNKLAVTLIATSSLDDPATLKPIEMFGNELPESLTLLLENYDFQGLPDDLTARQIWTDQHTFDLVITGPGTTYDTFVGLSLKFAKNENGIEHIKIEEFYMSRDNLQLTLKELDAKQVTGSISPTFIETMHLQELVNS